MQKTAMTDAEIMAYRAELQADPFARGTDAPYACTRALVVARGARQKAAKAKARQSVLVSYNVWIASDRNGVRATLMTLETRR